MKRAILFVFVLFACAIGFAALDKTSNHPTPSPSHVAAVFFDGIDHGDYRQACSVWEAARKQMSKCEGGLTMQLASSAAFGMFGGYKVIPHKVREWRTGSVEYANVEIAYAPMGGSKVVAHMRKRAGGPWLVWWVG